MPIYIVRLDGGCSEHKKVQREGRFGSGGTSEGEAAAIHRECKLRVLEEADARQDSGFRAGYGYEKGAQLISRDGHSLFTNSLIPLRAVLGGTAVEYADALIPTSSSSTWGAVKQSL